MSRRAQFVLAAAVVVAVALASMAVVYVQLGYPADAAAEQADEPDVADARRTLDVAVYRAAESVVDADDPSVAVERVDRGLNATAAELNASGAADDRAYRVRQNVSTADVVVQTSCPRGERRRFGPCRAVNGVVLQNRLGTPVVVAVAVDLSVAGPGVDTRITFVLRPYR